MTDAPSQQPAQPPTLATVADVMRPPLTSADQDDHAGAAACLVKHADASALMVLPAYTGQPIGRSPPPDARRVCLGNGGTVQTSRTAWSGLAVTRMRSCARAPPGDSFSLRGETPGA